ncbi:MAG TPA: hypothetical protein VNX68_19350 [Nitrosopumilaceae archaeon]|jgi:hypothetical protein|nr:hypothetical protein [Nitrosopumilaceae archaeon]
MTVTSIQRNFNNTPQIVNMEVTDSQATISATGWLNLAATIASIELANNGLWVWQPGDMVLVYSDADNTDVLYTVNSTTHSLILYSTAGAGGVTLPVVSGDFTVFSGTAGQLFDAGYSPSDPTKTKVVMAGSAVTVNHIAVFTDTLGTIDDDAATAINGGNIQAGLSGTAGTLASFPATAANGSLIVAAINAGGPFNTTISNSVMGQSSVISTPDPGVATSKFLLTDSAGTQTISTGNVAMTLGTLTLGSSGHASSLTIFPASAANGTLILAAANAGGAFNLTLSNGALAQSSVLTIPDVGASTGFVVTNPTQGKMKSVTAAAVAGGSASQTVTDAFCTTTSTVVANWNTSANPVSIEKVTPGNGSFVVLSSGDPGASTLGYIIMK